MFEKLRKIIITSYRFLYHLRQFLHTFHRSPEYRSWRSGTMSLDEAIRAFDDRDAQRHKQVMIDLEKRRWVLEQRIMCKDKELARLRREKERRR